MFQLLRDYSFLLFFVWCATAGVFVECAKATTKRRYWLFVGLCTAALSAFSTVGITSDIRVNALISLSTFALISLASASCFVCSRCGTLTPGSIRTIYCNECQAGPGKAVQRIGESQDPTAEDGP